MGLVQPSAAAWLLRRPSACGAGRGGLTRTSLTSTATKGRPKMLTVTEAAAEAITALTSQGEGDAGLRLAVQNADGESAQLALSVAPEPVEGDSVLGAEEGPKVFLEPQAAALLDDKV